MLTFADDKECKRMFAYKSTISSFTDSEDSTTQVKKWFKECTQNHQTCKSAFSPTALPPSRLIEISGDNEMALRARLRERKDLAADVEYATLSHC